MQDFLGISYDAAKKVIMQFNQTPEFRAMTPISGSKTALHSLSSKGVVAITSRWDDLRDVTLEWIAKYFPCVKDVNFARNVHNFPDSSKKSKGELCLELGVKVMIEDFGGYALDCASRGVTVLLPDKPWNKNVEHENIVRVHSWTEVLEYAIEI